MAPPSTTEPPGSADETAIEAVDLVKSYGRGEARVEALRGVGFTVGIGAVFGLLGPNGAGKSTTVKILTTLTLPDAGQARITGIDVTRHPEDVRRAIGVVTQKNGFDWTATGRENLDLQGRVYGMGGAALRQRVDELLERFDLGAAAKRPAGDYSGGMKRKLDVALGLVHRPRVLFLDEPTTGLDPEARSSMWTEIQRLAADERLTILLTTHYLEEADGLADQLAIVDRGRIVAQGTPDELKGELRGDAVTVELAGAADDRAVRALGAVAGVGEVSLDGRVVRARVERGATAVPQVLAALESAGLAVAAVTMARPSLDDVYLRHAGRSFTAADEGKAHA